MLTTFAIFALGFLTRPLGAILFSQYGDRYGRKKVLAVAVIMMALATACIGLLPTYAHIGISAAILLTLCRLLQGLAIGGEFSGSVVCIFEHAPVNRRGFYGSWVMASTVAGLILGSAVAALVQHFIKLDWAWRIPFLLGIVAGIVGLYVRLRMPETPPFNLLLEQKAITQKPLLTALSQVPITFLKALALDFLPAVSFFIIFIYLSSYLNIYFHVPLSTSLMVNAISLMVLGCMVPCIGYYADIYGRKPFILAGAIGFLLLSYPLFLLLTHTMIVSILLAQMIFALILSFCCAIMPVVNAELFPTQIRYMGIALPYNLAYTFLGVTAPLIIILLINKTGNVLAPSYYLIFAAIVLVLIVFTVDEA